MLECLPSSSSEKAQQNSVLMAKLACADQLERHLIASEVLCKYKLAPPFSFFQRCESAWIASVRAGNAGDDVPSPTLDDEQFEASMVGDEGKLLLLQIAKLGAAILDDSDALATLPLHVAPSQDMLLPWSTVLEDMLTVREHALPWVTKPFCFRACLFGLRAFLGRAIHGEAPENNSLRALLRAVEVVVAIGQPELRDANGGGVETKDAEDLVVPAPSPAQSGSPPQQQPAASAWGWGLIGGTAFSRAVKSELTGLITKISTTADNALK
jgi:hypothetical protein